MMVVIVLVLIAFALLVDWAIAHTFCEIARMKGHNERKYFWWCFSGLPGSVSYTHLDVYKRQVLACSMALGTEMTMSPRILAPVSWLTS